MEIMSLVSIDRRSFLSKKRAEDEWNLTLAFVQNRHTDKIIGARIVSQQWRMKERMKTVSVALVLCLNIGVDPPDIIKIQPRCARMECWIDPASASPPKALGAIGANLQKQYERWQPRARYKQSLDPSIDDVKKLCVSLRRSAKEERVLFHYNGHGVPKPTPNGELWVFNKNYTQYIPLSIYDLQTWMGVPSIYIYDCSNAGLVIDMFKQFAEQHEKEFEKAAIENPAEVSVNNAPSYKNCIQLAACSAQEQLPMDPDLPADVFTSCLTTPIKIAIRWFVLQNSSKLLPKITIDMIDKIPGQLNDRRTMLGELNWIFTAITDTIAWNALPRELFQKLFRQDLLVASLFRNFLLAERVMHSFNCSPQSSPKLPETRQHPMWQAWDLSLDGCLSQWKASDLTVGGGSGTGTYEQSPFFEQQLTAFEVWLKLGSCKREPPEQLPIVLQVLLSQVHRLRALELLSKFLDLGSWAVSLALCVGIFPYILKLLQSSARELRYKLSFIWAKILAVDPTCQIDLVRDSGHKYFLQILQDPGVTGELKTLAAFVLACIVKDHVAGQEAAFQGNLIATCLELMVEEDTMLRKWAIICLGQLWENHDKARWCGVRDLAHEKLYTLLKDDSPEIRAAVVFALGTFTNTREERTEHAMKIDQCVALTLMNICSDDISPLVRNELVSALQWTVTAFENSFLTMAVQDMKNAQNDKNKILSKAQSQEKIKVPGIKDSSVDIAYNAEKMRRVSSTSSLNFAGSPTSQQSSPMTTVGGFHKKVWQCLRSFESDPFLSVGETAHALTDYIRDQLKDTVFERQWSGDRSLSLPSSPANRTFFSMDPLPQMARSSPSDYSKSGNRIRAKHQSVRMTNTILPRKSEKKNPRVVKTNFVDWSAKIFTESRSLNPEVDVESEEYEMKRWIRCRNDILDWDADEECSRGTYFKLENQIFAGKMAHETPRLLLHPYEPHVITTSRDAFIVWDYNAGMKLSHWYPERCAWDKGKTSPSITDMDLVNACDQAMLLVASEDGCVRLWSNYWGSNNEPNLVTAWRATPVPEGLDLWGGSRMGDLKILWDQKERVALTGGDSRVIRVWDAVKELKIQDIQTATDAGLSAICSDCNGSFIFGAGFQDGSIRIFDRRLPPKYCRTIIYREHSARIISTTMAQSVAFNIVACCEDGVVKMFDLRQKSSITLCKTGNRTTAFDLHSSAHIFAGGFANQSVSLYKLNGNFLNSFRTNDWFLAAKGPARVSCLSFHPKRVALAYALSDGTISVSALDGKKMPVS